MYIPEPINNIIMGAYTFYNDDEIRNLISLINDIELRQLIHETNTATNRLFFVRQYEYYEKRYFKKPVKSVVYSLYVKTHDGEARCINFAKLKGENECTLNFNVNKAFIMTYLFGVLTGHKFAQKP